MKELRELVIIGNQFLKIHQHLVEVNKDFRIRLMKLQIHYHIIYNFNGLKKALIFSKLKNEIIYLILYSIFDYQLIIISYYFLFIIIHKFI